MSFLNPVRLSFAGTFQADVSTVNNDVRHYDSANFRQEYQEYEHPGGIEGRWNPTGSGAFRLIDCRVTAVWWPRPTPRRRAADPVVGQWITGSAGRTSAKIVDLDPQWQAASEIWGLDVRLTDGKTEAIFGGRFRPAAFRDLWLYRQVSVADGDQAASATFQSVLDDVVWDEPSMRRSPFLERLRAGAGDGLSIRLTTFGYHRLTLPVPQFTFGTVVGVIGPQLPGEPASFLAGRRFAPAREPASRPVTAFTGTVDEDSATVFLDLSNALRIRDSEGTPCDIGPLVVGILGDPACREGDSVTAATFEPIAEIPYRDTGWLAATGGVFAARTTAARIRLARDRPLAVIAGNQRGSAAEGERPCGEGVVVIRETTDGRFVGAEPLVHRIDAGHTSSLTVHVRRYGVPQSRVTVRLVPFRPDSPLGGTKGHPSTAPLPEIGVPDTALRLPRCRTDVDGTARVRLRTADPGNPRGYIDGQVYLVDYRLPGADDAAPATSDLIAVHVRQKIPIPAEPSWDHDIKPIFTQYANLYPIMSRELVDLADFDDVLRHRALLELAFSLGITDPNSMPVSRDLSRWKVRLIRRWLRQMRGLSAAVLDPAVTLRAPAAVAGVAPERPPAGSRPPFSDSKVRFLAALERASRSPGSR